jgi:CheY-like chemotaxis protein
MIDTATILVADDSSDDIELLKRALQKAGLNNPVRYVCDGNEAIRYLTENDGSSSSGSPCPLLLLLDLNMPHCSGFGVLDWLRRHPHLQNLPTVVFTNSNQPSDIDQSLRLGAHGYWVKPSRFEDLVKLMAGLKETLRRVTERVESEFPLPAAA